MSKTILYLKQKTKLKLSCLGHIRRRQGSSEKTIMLGKIEESWKRERPNVK